MISAKNMKVIGGVIAAAVLLVATLGFNSFSTNVEAQKLAANESRPAFPTFCPPKFVQHWDKIHFDITATGRALLPDGEIITITLELSDVDIKVIDRPDSVADLKGKIIEFMEKNPTVDPSGQTVFPNVPEGSEIRLEQADIIIHDVEYAITCTVPVITAVPIPVDEP